MIIDCDPGHDDAIALILAHSHAEVLGITTVAGNTSIDNTTANALGICELLGVGTQVYRGASKPLRRESTYAHAVHGESGLGDVELPRHSRTESTISAVEYLLENVDTDVWVVPIGPLTNIAQVIQEDPDWGSRIAGLSIMGGSTTVGNVTAVAEFNISHDPEAADIVWRSGIPIKMCGLNLTHQLIADDSIVACLREANPSNSELKTLATFAADCYDNILAAIENLRGQRQAALHDLCAVLALTHPDLFRFEDRHVAVETTGTHTSGMTVVDERFSPGKTANTEVAYEIDSDRAMSIVLGAFGAE